MNCNKLIFLLVLCITPTLSNQWRADQKQKFLKWKADYKKSYPSSEEETRAMDSMLKNQDQIEAHNKKFAEGKVSFERGLWKRSDLSFDEKQKLLTGSKDLPAEPDKLTLQAAPVNMKSAPSSLDWTKAGRVHAVDDQNICGSCYAFATVGVMEGVLLSKNISTRLSVQQIVDCNQSNEGCGGGEPILSLKYAKINGLASASQYPYTSKEGKCKSYPKLSEIRSVGRVALNGNENRLKVFVANYGPVAGKKVGFFVLEIYLTSIFLHSCY